MARSLKEISHIIMTERPNTESWLALEEEVSVAMETANEEEIEVFVESGAGEILDMTCSAIRNIQKNH